jgi:hypothetical protein
MKKPTVSNNIKCKQYKWGTGEAEIGIKKKR